MMDEIFQSAVTDLLVKTALYRKISAEQVVTPWNMHQTLGGTSEGSFSGNPFLQVALNFSPLGATVGNAYDLYTGVPDTLKNISAAFKAVAPSASNLGASNLNDIPGRLYG